MTLLGKMGMTLASLGLICTLAYGTAQAETVDQVKAKVKAEYAAGAIAWGTYNDLMSLLDSAASAATPSDYSAATEAYNMLVSGMSGSAIKSEAAARLTSNFD